MLNETRKNHMFTVVFAVGVLLIMFTVYQLAQVVLLGLTALLLSFGVVGIVRWLSRVTNLSYTWSYTALLAVTLFSLVVSAWVFGDWINGTTVSVAGQFNSVQQTVVDSIERTQFLSNEAVNQLLSEVNSFVGSQGMFSQLASGVGSAVTIATQTALVVLVALYLAATPRSYLQGVIQLAPKNRRVELRVGVYTMYQTVLKWFAARLFSMAVVGILTYIGLLILGIPYAGALALLTFALSFIPNLGPVLSFIPAGLVAFSIGINPVLYVLGLYVAVQAAESNFITPLVEQRLVATPPALLLLAQLAGGTLFGILGVLLAAPIVASIIALAQQHTDTE